MSKGFDIIYYSNAYDSVEKSKTATWALVQGLNLPQELL